MRSGEVKIGVLYNRESSIQRGEPYELLALQETAQVAHLLCETIQSLGYPVFEIPVVDSLYDLQQRLSQLAPEDTFIFSICDEFEGSGMGVARVIAMVEDMGFAHTGASPETIVLCTDKAAAKQRMAACGIPTPAHEVFIRPVQQTRLPFPVFVKPVSEDGSLGIARSSVARDQAELIERVEYVLEKYHQPALVERFIPGREFSVAMWGNERVELLPISEIDYSRVRDPLHQFLTFHSKWVTESEEFTVTPPRCPAALSGAALQRVSAVARRAFRSFGLRDFGRVDIRYYNGVPYVLDINEIPDMDPASGFFSSAAKRGYSYPEAVKRVLEIALLRRRSQRYELVQPMVRQRARRRAGVACRTKAVVAA